MTPFAHTYQMLAAILLACALSSPALAQPSQAEQDAIVAEAQELFLLELAAWQGADAMFNVAANGQSDAYLSYRDGDSLRTIFYLAADQGQVLGEVAFDSLANVASMRLQVRPRNASAPEKALMTMRANLLAACLADKKGTFAQYENTSMNILLLPGPRPLGFLLTAPMEAGVLMLGNDYRFEFDQAGKVLKYNSLHKKLHVLDMRIEGEASGHVHTKGEDPVITSTDLCALLLYSQLSDWKHHVVQGPNYISIWDLEERQLVILTKKAWDKINAKQAQQE